MNAPLVFEFSDHEQASLAAAEHVLKLATTRSDEWFNLAVSGGSTPTRLFELLAGMDDFPWPAVRLFWVDERCVVSDHADSNFATCKRVLIEHTPLTKQQIFRMHGELGAEAGAMEYERQMRQVFGENGDMPQFDCILLGIGGDGHTASLFPGHPALEEQSAWVVPVTSAAGNPSVDRISLSLPVLNAAKNVLFLVTGTSKQEMVRRLVTEKDTSLPAGRVRAQSRVWILDQAAAGNEKRPE